MATLKTYALDLTGAKASNKIAGEVKTISKDADRVFIPTGGPFYTKSLKVWSGTTLLKPLVDYVALELNREGTVDSGKEVCNVLYIKNAAENFKLDYQVIGGQYADLTNELTALLNATPIDKLNVLTWGSILNKPTIFPPTAHTHYPYEWRGYTQVIHLLEQLRQVVVAGDAASIASVYQYVENNVKDIAMDYIDKNGLFFIDKTPSPDGNVILDGLGTSASPLKINLNELFDELDKRYFQNSINPLSRVGAISDSFLPIAAGFFNCACPLITAVGMSVVGNVERNGDLLLLTPATNGEIVRYVYGYVRGWSSDPNIQRYRPTNQQYRPPGLAENEEIMDLCGYHEQSMIGAIFTINADGTSEYKEHCIIWLNGTFAAESHVLVRVGSNITKVIPGSTVANLYAHSPKVVKLRRGEIYLLSHSNGLDVNVHSFNPVNNVFTQVTGWTGILQKNVIKADEPVDIDIVQSTTESTFATGQTALRPLVFWPEQATLDDDGKPKEFVVYDVDVLNPEAITSHNRATPGTDRSRMQVRVVGDKVLLYTVSIWLNSIYDPEYRGGNVTYAGYSLEVTPLDMKYRWVRHSRENDAHGGAGTTAERGKLDIYATSSWSATPYDLYSYRGWWDKLQPHTLLALNDGRVLNWAHPTEFGLSIHLQSYQYTKNLANTPNVDRMFNLYFNTKFSSHASHGAGRSRSIGVEVLNLPAPTVNNVNSTAIVLADDTVILQESIANPSSGNWSKVRHTAYRPSQTIVDYPTVTHGVLKGYDTTSDRIELLSETGETTFDIIPWVSVRLANGTRKVGSLVWHRPLNGVWVDQSVPANVKIDWDNKKLVKSEFYTMNLQTFNAIEDFVKSNLSVGGTLLHHTWTLIASPEVPTQGLLCFYGGRQDRKIFDRVVQVKIAYNGSKVMSSINFGSSLLLEASATVVPVSVHDPREAFPRLQWVVEYNADKSESFWAGKLPNSSSSLEGSRPRTGVYSFKCAKDLGGNDLFTSLTSHGGGQLQTSAYKSLVATNTGVGFMQDTIGYGVFRGLFRYKGLTWTEGSMFVDEDPFIWVTPRPPSDFSITVTDTIDVQIGGVFGRIEPVTYDLTDPTVSDVINPRNKTIYIYVTLELGEPRLNFREIPMAESVYIAYIGKVITDEYGIMEVDIQPLTRIGNYRPSATPRGSSFSVSSGTADTERLLNWDAHVFNSVGQEGPQQSGNVPLGVISNPGTYEYVVAPGDNFFIELIGAGGGGGSSNWSTTTGIDLHGRQGDDSFFHVNDQVLFVASGGPGGIGAFPIDGSTYTNGVVVGGSSAAIANNVDHPLTISEIVLIHGNPGVGRTAGLPFRQLTATPAGKGGDGGGAPIMDDQRSFGGGGASGAYVAFFLRNQTNETVKIKFIIGNGGAGGISHSPDGNSRGVAGAPGAFRISN